ncbi:hypothetical protein MHF_0554 [Mycoplasma haemofelis Ohio2]|uniref:Uncharacterized protein n=1 Tax=Mycoplasma haemofelis (strain Ohio2) TaxID=859194 RepID=F6FHX8_MYCHI|nr:hypothetical protein MHF_0554 [Mycoplasma haemofelis Ohio2]
MSRSLLMASTATAGAGAGVGSLVINSPKPESQVSYRTTSSQEPELIDEEFEEQEEGSKEEVTVKEELKVASAPVNEPAKSWWDNCSFYTVASSSNKTSRTSDYSFVTTNIKDSDALKKIEDACKKSKKVYVAKPQGYDWTYRESDQSITWSIVSN